MKTLRNSFLLSLLLLTASCQKNSHEHDINGDTNVESSPNTSLYEEVMKIHDEVMPKMNDLHKAKTSLRTRSEMPGLREDERQAINLKISRIDSASEGMMIWMRQFNPVPDSAGEEKAKAYLESELVKVKKVREDILEALKASGSED